ncbi:MAG: permease-like cell division protein FtsX [Candidatus Hatepunaea meridiana]|nr:permease-like cell division protein FtsX [Candidatus Hatepunaea meridiana]
MILFSLREGWKNFSNISIIGLLSLISLTITLLLIGFAARGFILIEDWKSGMLGRFEIEAFLSEDTTKLRQVLTPDATILEGITLDSTFLEGIARQIKALTDVEEVTYVSKTAAARRFTKQFGEELFDLLEYNPLPASYVVKLKRDADPSKSWERTSIAIEEIPGVDDVVYEGDLLLSVDRFYRSFGTVVAIAVMAALIVSMLLTILSVQSVIRSKEEFIRIVTLSGGTRWMARGPFVMLGAYYGIISGLFAAGVISLISWIISISWELGTVMPLWWLFLIVAIGAVFGMIGAGWAAGRRIREV